ncbi:GrxC Glutaredoxin and related proteins [uncultured Caudovirales phage]|jgi:glutaredoxin|uniref:GrxC Glutaredoxin and related proteins n=1 Tax=uncultured Caudovirales phage TaxID=2100421 RepID=A0A6J5M1J4_9CAUD|nr:GrxC Glutaredoxin and related proteins [uncultured Caudovirales phage]
MNVEIYTKDDCAYCMMAKQLMAVNNIQYVEHKLHHHFSRGQLQEKFPEAKSFPIIVLDGFYIGGYTHLKSYLDEQVASNKTLLNE